MGNWRTVRIVGTMSAEDASSVKKYLSCGFDGDDWGCLHNGGLAGLPNWGRTNINCIGNLGERGYDEDSIQEELDKISQFAPSMNLIVHLGDNYESTKCVKSIKVENKNVEILEPLIDDIGGIPQEQIRANLMQAIGR